MKTQNIPFLFALLLAISCASAPSVSLNSTPNSISSPPDWTSRPVSMEGSKLVFVLTGPANADVAKLALPAMTAYLDIPVTPETPVVAAQAVQKFLLRMSSTAPSDHFTRGDRVWWKIEVSQDSWNGARTELAKLVQDPKADPSLSLERVADDLLHHGKYTEALTGYAAAAMSAVPEGRPSQPVLRSRSRCAACARLGFLRDR